MKDERPDDITSQIVKASLAKVPELELVATHDFLYEIQEVRPFDDELFDALVILRKRQPA